MRIITGCFVFLANSAGMAIDTALDLEKALAEVPRASDVILGELVVFTHIDQMKRLAPSHTSQHLCNRTFLHP